jgi:hypothetical protein
MFHRLTWIFILGLLLVLSEQGAVNFSTDTQGQTSAVSSDSDSHSDLLKNTEFGLIIKCAEDQSIKIKANSTEIHYPSVRGFDPTFEVHSATCVSSLRLWRLFPFHSFW